MPTSEPRLAAGWILDPGLQAWSASPDSTPKQGALPVALPLPTHSLPGAWLPSAQRGTPDPALPSRFRGHCKRPPSPFAVVHCKSGFLHNSDRGGGVEDVGEAEALPNQK